MNYLIIAGGRDFDDEVTFLLEIQHWFDRYDFHRNNTTIISGMARGADALAVRYAKDSGLPLIEMPADWDAHGNHAGPIRNQQMADIATHVLVFWDGHSKGTKDMIARARVMGLHLTVVKYPRKVKKYKPVKTLW